MTDQKATFAAGCFWGVEEAFRTVEGVLSTEVGFCGGRTKNPNYRDVCLGDTGHAECVRITFDPDQITYDQLLKILWRTHDPTQKNRQGPDVGAQYRSAIFWHDEAQRAAAERSKLAVEQSGRFTRPIVTEIAPASTFWRADDHHQQYLAKRSKPSCHL